MDSLGSGYGQVAGSSEHSTTPRFYKRQGISWLTGLPTASPEELCSVQSVNTNHSTLNNPAGHHITKIYSLFCVILSSSLYIAKW